MQVNTLIYAMGDDADDILRSFRLSTSDSKKYDTVKAKFDAHFVKRRKVTYERAKFNLHRQGDGESVDSFITAQQGLLLLDRFRLAYQSHCFGQRQLGIQL